MTEHISSFKDGHQFWVAGDTCDECRQLYNQKRDQLNTGAPMTNLFRLKADNAGGYTQRELGREVIDAAKRDGREIERAR